MSLNFSRNWFRVFFGIISLLCLTLFIQASYAHAQPANTGNPAPTPPSGNALDDYAADVGVGVKSLVGAAGTFGDCVADPGGCIIDSVGTLILTFTTFLLAIAGVLLNLVVVKLVFQFADVIGNSPGLLLSWRMLRDLGNMALLFGFIFIGIATLLGIAKYSYKQALPKLIIVAVAMNFSLFIAEAVIDTSNAFAAVMYEQASQGKCPQDLGTASTEESGFDPNFNSLRNSECLLNYGIAGSLMEATGLAEILTLKEFGVGRGSPTVYLGLSLLTLIGAIVMFAAAIMLLIRAVTLTFVMITAPLGFAAMAIPPLQPQARKWWDYLLKQSFFAPILILLLLISIKVTETFSKQGEALTLAGALTNPNASAMGIILVFALVIGFLIASLMVAKSMGAVGSGFAIKTAGSAVLGTTGWVGRNTAGRGSARIARSVRTSSLGKTETGRRIAGVFDRGAGASFDMRGTKAFKNASKAGKLDFGAPSKKASGGIAAGWKAKGEKRAKYADSLVLSSPQEKEKKELEDTKKAEGEKHKTKLENIKKRREAEEKRRAAELGKLDADIIEREASHRMSTDPKHVQELERQIEEARKDSDDLLNKGDTNGSVEAHRKQLALQKELAGLNERNRLNGEEIERLRAARDAEDKRATEALEELAAEEQFENLVHKDENKRLTARLDELDPKKVYANNLHDENGKNPISEWRGTARRRKETADAIRKKMKQGPIEKQLEGVQKALKEQTEKADDAADAADAAGAAEEKADDDKGGGK